MNEVARKAIVSIDMICFPRLISPLASCLLELLSSDRSTER